MDFSRANSASPENGKLGLASGVGHPAQLTACIAETLIFLGGLEGRAGISVAAKTA